MKQAIAVMAVLVVGCEAPPTDPSPPDISGVYEYVAWDTLQPRYEISGAMTLRAAGDGSVTGCTDLVRTAGSGMEAIQDSVRGAVEGSSLTLTLPWRHTATITPDSICGTVTIPQAGYEYWQGEFCLRRR